MKNIGIIYHPMIEAAGQLARDLEQFLLTQKVRCWIGSAWDISAVKSRLGDTDLLLTVGGDGTILRAAQAVVPAKTPITGINLGKLGFLTELNLEEAKEGIDRLLQGEGWYDERALLEAEIRFPNAHQTNCYYALNDVVVARGAFARVISVEVVLNNELLTTYKGDGVILATATGSTGYALAAGGPVLQPQAKELVLVPIMPHLSGNYPLVLPLNSIIGLRVQAVHPATVSIDGHTNLSSESDTELFIKRSAQTIRFFRIHPETYFYTSLQKRLKG